MRRRQFLGGSCGLALAALFPTACGAQPRLSERGTPFDLDTLRERARQLATRPPRPVPSPASELVESIDYDAFQRIRFREDATLFADRLDTPPIQFFHLGRHNRHPVRVHVVEGGRARELRYDRSLFEYDDPEMARRVPRELGFGGFRALHRDRPGDWLAFSGASYFRSSGELDQYGLSARGIAIGTGLPEPEEFPRFSELWLEPASEGAELTVYALLEGESLTGAYRFRCSREGAIVMDTDAYLYPRGPIERLGVAPLTSMFWFSETNRHRATDWRPEVHDSDGLAMWTGSGERLLRPLRNPTHGVRVHTYQDRDPRGFGLVQRDRAFEHYQDDGVFYEKRPTAWIEPRGRWGEGEVMLVEIPTDDEIFDNIVAFWRPHAPTRAGQELHYAYKLHWSADEPHFPAIGRVIATRKGRAGVPGQPRPEDGVKFVVDFEGGALGNLGRGEAEPVVSTSRGRIENPYALPVVGTQRWRVVFDVHAEGDEDVELRCYLRRNGEALTETWLYPYRPFRFV